MSGLIGLSDSSLAPCQYRPLCWPSSLTSFCANCLERPAGGRAQYCFCFSTRSWHASIAASSFFPMRRKTISSFCWCFFFFFFFFFFLLFFFFFLFVFLCFGGGFFLVCVCLVVLLVLGVGG